MSELKKKEILYYARIIPTSSVYEVCELSVRTVEENWFVGIDKRDKHAYLFKNSDLDKHVFKDRKEALTKVLDAESNKKDTISDVYYEEY